MVAYAEKSFEYYFTAGECWLSLMRFTGMYCIGSPRVLSYASCLSAVAFDSAPVVLIMNQVHMLGRKNDTQEGTTCGGFAAARFLINDCCSCAEVRLSVEFEKAMGEISKFNRTG